MFKSIGSILGFLFGVLLTVGLILTPHLMPWGYRIGLSWTAGQIAAAALAGMLLLGLTLWTAGKLIAGARTWKDPKVIAGVVLIAFVANALFCCLVEFFALRSGMRTLVALLGVPVIYGNLSAVLGKTSLKMAMLNILSGALATIGGGFMLAAIIRGW